MKIIHLALTPLAGSPIRIVNAINTHTKVNARLAVYDSAIYGTRTFEEDLTWEKNREEIIDLIHDSDIIHLHHYINLKENPFKVNFKERVWSRCHRRFGVIASNRIFRKGHKSFKESIRI